jgi:hypothetical protein
MNQWPVFHTRHGRVQRAIRRALIAADRPLTTIELAERVDAHRCNVWVSARKYARTAGKRGYSVLWALKDFVRDPRLESPGDLDSGSLATGRLREVRRDFVADIMRGGGRSSCNASRGCPDDSSYLNGSSPFARVNASVPRFVGGCCNLD